MDLKYIQEPLQITHARILLEIALLYYYVCCLVSPYCGNTVYTVRMQHMRCRNLRMKDISSVLFVEIMPLFKNFACKITENN